MQSDILKTIRMMKRAETEDDEDLPSIRIMRRSHLVTETNLSKESKKITKNSLIFPSRKTKKIMSQWKMTMFKNQDKYLK